MNDTSPTYKVIEIFNHGKIKYQIVFGKEERHLAYVNSKDEANNLVRHLNSKVNIG
jgi:hypothetical protein